MSYLQSTGPPVFSSFDDIAGYAGKSPSSQFLRFVYIQFLRKIRPHLDAEVQKRSCTVLCIDTSHKVTKDLACIGGERIFEGLVTGVNQDGEIKLQVFAYNKGHDQYRISLEKLRDGAKNLGLPCLKAIYTDNSYGEKKLYCSIFKPETLPHASDAALSSTNLDALALKNHQHVQEHLLSAFSITYSEN